MPQEDPTSKSVLNEKENLKNEIEKAEISLAKTNEIDLEKHSKKKNSSQTNHGSKTESNPKHGSFISSIINRISRPFIKPPTMLKSSKIIPKENNKSKLFCKIIKFFGVLILVLKAMKLFRSRTKYKTLDQITDKQLDLINDFSYVKRNKTDRRIISFINNKFLRKTIRSFKIFFKSKKKYFIKIQSKFFIL